jgi:hypothetical protein
MADQALAAKADFHKTKLESFLVRKGSIVVKIIHDLGGFARSYNSALALSTLRLFEPGNEQNCSEGIRIEVREGGSDNGHISFLDQDEVASLLQGLDYMANCLAQSQGYRGDYTEMIFSTRGDFSVGFYLSDGKSQAFVRSGSDQAFISPPALRQLSSFLRTGLEHLATTPIVRPS